MNDNEELDEFSIIDDPKFFQEITEEIWKEDFEKVGYIYIRVGDEPNGYASRVYKDKHREFIGFDKDFELEVKGIGSDFDWEKALHENC